MRILLEGVVNHLDSFWLPIVTLFSKGELISLEGDMFFYGSTLTVYLDANILRIGDAWGYNVWRVKYDPPTDKIIIYKGVSCVFGDIYGHDVSFDWVKHAKKAFREHYNKKIDKILLTD